MKVMGGEYTKITIMNRETKEEIAVVTDDDITTATPEIVVKLTPDYDKD